MYKLAICDDDTDFCASLEAFLYGYFTDRNMECSVVSFSDTQSFNTSVDNGNEYDLVFLDIVFEDDNGMNCAKRLRSQNYKFDIVFVTTCREYAVESFDVNPLYYIVKPIETEKITAAIERFIEKNAPRYVCFNSLGDTIKIELSDILYFEIYGHRIIIHKSNGTQSTIRGTLKDVEALLPPAMFVRPHRSYLVNIQAIKEISHYSIKITNGEFIPISKAQYNKIRFEFLDYLDKHATFI